MNFLHSISFFFNLFLANEWCGKWFREDISMKLFSTTSWFFLIFFILYFIEVLISPTWPFSEPSCWQSFIIFFVYLTKGFPYHSWWWNVHNFYVVVLLSWLRKNDYYNKGTRMTSTTRNCIPNRRQIQDFNNYSSSSTFFNWVSSCFLVTLITTFFLVLNLKK